MGVRTWVSDWPAFRQLTGSDPLGRGRAAMSARTEQLRPRTDTADRVVSSVCPYCAVGCGQQIYVKDDKVVQIEGDPDSPVSRGRLCPKGSATLQLTTGSARRREVLYRRPYATDWEPLDLETAMDMVAERVVETRRRTWEWESEGLRTARTLGIASLGGATLDNEENYLIKKLLTGLGVVQVENQARVCHSSTVAGLGTSFGRGGATTFMQDLQHADCIVIQGSNFAEAHPVGFQWVMEAKARGARIIHVDPRFTRTSALADLHVPIRAGSDIAFLGGIINHVLTEEKDFREYVLAYTNAATLVSEDFRDTEDLDGVFSGLDEDKHHYDPSSWQYEGVEVQQPTGEVDEQYEERVHGSGSSESHGSGGAQTTSRPPRDETLRHPRCVYQILKRHYARYTPELVEDVCGIPRETFLQVCEALTANSGRERTSAFAYAVGWTQHSVGAQYIRAASVLQLLLGNIGRPGGGIQALRGHASIQGSSDIPTLFNLLPGYLPMPHAHAHEDLDAFIEASRTDKGFWGNMRAYFVSLLKAYYGDAATAANDFCFDHLPRLTGSHSTYDTVMAQLDGVCKGYFLMGENPAVGSANTRLQRLGMANLEWLVVRDFSLIESATWWQDGPEIETGELRTEGIGTEVFFFPAAAHTEKNGSFTNTNRWLQWHHAAVEPEGDARSDLWFMYHLGRRIKERLAASTDPMDRPVQDLTWDYPVDGPLREPVAAAVLAEINGHGPDGAPSRRTPSSRTTARRGAAAGSTAGCTRTASTRPPAANPEANRTGWPPSGPGPGPPTGASSTTEPRPPRTAHRGASARRTSGGTRTPTGGPDTTSRTSYPTAPPTSYRTRTRPVPTRCAATTRSSCRPTARAGSTRPRAWRTARSRRTTNRRTRPSPTPSTPPHHVPPYASCCPARATATTRAATRRVPRSSRTSSPRTASPSTSRRAA